MKKVLLLNGSISQESNSFSNAVIEKLLQDYKAQHPNDEITTYNLNETHSHVIATSNNLMKYYRKIESEKWIDLLNETDKLIIVSSEVNFNSTPVVKNFIDSIMIPQKTFYFNENEELVGMLKHLEVLLITSRGSDKNSNSWATNYTWQKGIWEILGAKKILHLNIHGTSLDRNKNLTRDEIQAKYQSEIDEVLKNF